MKYILFVFCTFTLISCKKAPQHTEGDYALRAFLNVRSLSGEYTIPDTDAFYEIVALEFENGKMMSRSLTSYGGTKHMNTRILRPQLLFQPSAGKTSLQLSSTGSTAKTESSFWSQLDGGWSSVNPARPVKYLDYTILGFSMSNLESTGKLENTGYGDFKEALRVKKYLGALAIRSAPSREALTEQDAATNP